MISTVSHDLKASNDSMAQKWVGRLHRDNKKTHKEVV
jgi:hypothetical protein